VPLRDPRLPQATLRLLPDTLDRYETVLDAHVCPVLTPVRGADFSEGSRGGQYLNRSFPGTHDRVSGQITGGDDGRPTLLDDRDRVAARMPRVTEEGLVEIPGDVREALGIESGDEVRFTETDAGSSSRRSGRSPRMEKTRSNGTGGLPTRTEPPATRCVDSAGSSRSSALLVPST
jgi:hypothetical protein